jgi:hypothetical protein
MTVAEFTQILVSEMEADSSTDFVDKMLKAARAQVAAGNGSLSSLTNTSQNGKSAARTVEMTAAETLKACRDALKIYLSDGDNDDSVSSTYADFSLLSR